MNANKFCRMFLGAAILSTGLVGCVEPEETGGAPIDHQSAQQAITESVNNIGESITNSLAFLEESKLFSDNYNFFLGGGYTCESDSEGGEDWCEPQDPTPFDSDVSGQKDELIRALNDHIFTQQNVESVSADTVTYLLKGSVVCAYNTEAETEDRDRCVQFVDDAQIRLVASSPAAGSADVSVKIGPNRISPVSFEFHPTLISASPNIGEIKKAAEYLVPLIDEDADTSGFPTVAKGELRLSLEKTGEKKLEGKVGITQAIELSGGEWGLQLAAAPNGFVIAADGLAKTVKASLGLGAISGLFPFQSGYYFGADENGDEVESGVITDPVAAKLEIGGLTGAALFEAGKELLSLTNLGLGDKTSTLDLNGKRVLSVDLNKEDGRSFDIAIEKTGEHTKFELSPAFDLRMVFAFAQIQGELEKIADWMLDEVLSVKFSGASPAFEMIDGDIKVVSGKLTLAAEKAGIHHEIEAGQCLINSGDVDDEANEPVDPSEEGGSEEGTESNPMEHIEIGTCG